MNKICVCGAAIENEDEECEVCGLVYEIHQPKAELDLETLGTYYENNLNCWIEVIEE